MSKEWFDKHHSSKSDEVFEGWWKATYGPPESYGSEQDEQDDYWIRKGFALMGWIARGERT